jgi:hypothetical protein
MESFELGVLFLPSRYRHFERTFSCTPEHRLLGLGCPGQAQITRFHAVNATQAKWVAL